jgi:hypothetical protein
VVISPCMWLTRGAAPAGFQTLYHSLTQQGSGHWEGLTFIKQFETAFKVRATFCFTAARVCFASLAHACAAGHHDELSLADERPPLGAQVQPDYLFISTWNEHIAQPQTPSVLPPLSMGLESDTTSNERAFVGALGQDAPAGGGSCLLLLLADSSAITLQSPASVDASPSTSVDRSCHLSYPWPGSFLRPVSIAAQTSTGRGSGGTSSPARRMAPGCTPS